jgi:lysozyme
MHTGKNGLELIKSFEGFTERAEPDPIGLPTIGYGTLIDSKQEQYLMNVAITREEAERLLINDVYEVERAIKKMVSSINISQNQFDALVCFAYNIGWRALAKSTLIKKVLRDPNDLTIRNEFMKWSYAGGKKFKGLERRREAEANLYFLGIKLDI